MNLRNGSKQILFFICQLVIANSSLSLFSGCQGDAVPSSDEDRSIQVYATNGGTNPSDTDGLSWEAMFARIDETDAGGFPENYPPGNNALVTATFPANSGKVQFTPTQYYHISGYQTRLVGWYPADGKWDSTTGTISYSDVLDGATDVMVTSAVQGSFTNKFQNITFSHQLAKVYLFAYLEKEKYKDAWGQLTKVAFADQPETCVLTLAEPGATPWEKPIASFIGEKKYIYFRNLDSTDNMSAVELTTAPSEEPAVAATPLGYVLVPPQTITEKSLKLIVTTENCEKLEISMPHEPELEFKPGMSYNLTIKLGRKGAALDASITSWNEEEKEEEDREF